MHEVSLMSNLLETVERAASKEGAEIIRVIHLRIGEMAGVNIDALSFAFDVLSKGTMVEGGKLEFERVPLCVRCQECGLDSQLNDFIFRCDRCGSPDIEILTGREIEVDYIILDDECDSGQEKSAY